MQTVCTHVFALEEVTGIVAHGKRHGDANVFSLDCTLILHVHDCQRKTQWLYIRRRWKHQKSASAEASPFRGFSLAMRFGHSRGIHDAPVCEFSWSKKLSDNTRNRKRFKLYKWVNETTSRTIVGPQQRTGFAHNDEETRFTSPIRKPASAKSQFSIPVTGRFADKPVRWQSVRRWQLTVE